MDFYCNFLHPFLNRDLSGYFDTVAAFEEEQANQDREWFEARTNLMQKYTNSYSGEVVQKLKKIMNLAMAKSVADLVMSVIKQVAALLMN